MNDNDYGVISEQGFITECGFGFNPLTEEEKEQVEKNKKED